MAARHYSPTDSRFLLNHFFFKKIIIYSACVYLWLIGNSPYFKQSLMSRSKKPGKNLGWNFKLQLNSKLLRVDRTDPFKLVYFDSSISKSLKPFVLVHFFFYWRLGSTLRPLKNYLNVDSFNWPSIMYFLKK
jgi:hypothetical protein